MNRKYIIPSLILSLLFATACTSETGAEELSNIESRIETKTETQNTTGVITPAPTMQVITEPASKPTPEPLTLKVGSYNICRGEYVWNDYCAIAADISALELDIVGIQEVDELTNRNGRQDTLKELSDALGFDYYEFSRAIYFDEGQFGIGVVSKYPILSYETILLDSKNFEQRVLGCAVIDVDGNEICFYNTHLSYEKSSLNKAQFTTLSETVKSCGKEYILTGDFNTSDFALYDLFEGASLASSEDEPLLSYKGNRSIDNIICSEEFDMLDKGLDDSVHHSDHSLIWAELSVKR